MAVLFPLNRSVRDPYRLVIKVAERFRQRGGTMVQGDVTGFTRAEGMRGVRLKDGCHIAADEVVICAGAHSARLSMMLDEPVPLETERGYHTRSCLLEYP